MMSSQSGRLGLDDPFGFSYHNPNQMYHLERQDHGVDAMKYFEHLFAEQKLTDVTITCEGATIKCHKIILAAFSGYFRQLFVSGCGGMNPASPNHVGLNNIEMRDFKLILDFIYKGHSAVPQEQIRGLLRAAEILNVKGLAKGASDNFMDSSSMHKPYGDSLFGSPTYAPRYSTYDPFGLPGCKPWFADQRFSKPAWPMMHSRPLLPYYHDDLQNEFMSQINKGFVGSPPRKSFNNDIDGSPLQYYQPPFVQSTAGSTATSPKQYPMHCMIKKERASPKKKSTEYGTGQPPLCHVKSEYIEEQGEPMCVIAKSEVVPNDQGYAYVQTNQVKVDFNNNPKNINEEGPLTKMRRYKVYSPAELKQALQEVKDGMSPLKVSRKYGIPSRTLYERAKKLGIVNVKGGRSAKSSAKSVGRGVASNGQHSQFEYDDSSNSNSSQGSTTSTTFSCDDGSMMIMGEGTTPLVEDSTPPGSE